MVRSSQLVTSALLPSSVRSGRGSRPWTPGPLHCVAACLRILSLGKSLALLASQYTELRGLVHFCQFGLPLLYSPFGSCIIANLFAFPPFVFIGTFARKLVNSTLRVHICPCIVPCSFTLRLLSSLALLHSICQGVRTATASFCCRSLLLLL